jgi:predicted SnoaL-like aldol condensation-catalyzing enzyme
MGTVAHNQELTNHGSPIDPLLLTSNKDAAIDFMHLVSSGHVKQAFSSYVGHEFKHHNPFFAAGALSLMNAMDANAKEYPEKEFTLHHVIAEGNLVAVHGHVRHEPQEIGHALVHLFRFANGKIVEMWDLGQEIPSSSPNRDGMF